MTGLVLKTFDVRAVRAHPDVKQFYAGLGYTGESEHQDTCTISTSVHLLAQVYLTACEESCCSIDGNKHPIYARAPPQTSAWVMSRQRKSFKKRKSVKPSLYETSEDAQVYSKKSKSSNVKSPNPFSKFEFDASGEGIDEDVFMERSCVTAPLPIGLNGASVPHVNAQLFVEGSKDEESLKVTTSKISKTLQDKPKSFTKASGLSRRSTPDSKRSAISDEQRRYFRDIILSPTAVSPAVGV